MKKYEKVILRVDKLLHPAEIIRPNFYSLRDPFAYKFNRKKPYTGDYYPELEKREVKFF